ncbi:hypothetical protein DNTS_023647 [Danionella cerebrum]|uniref:Uncharacterized protein n=1 Tax=Danionella cerebrum TaxID=2873325 RepID=A0A553QY73_9TELE|nr:hypothetical protein DNTS_023647 [Danionella translucida]
MPQLSPGYLWSCWKRSTSQELGGEDEGLEEKEEVIEGEGDKKLKKKWMEEEESPLHPAVDPAEAVVRLLLAGLMGSILALCALAIRFLLKYQQCETALLRDVSAGKPLASNGQAVCDLEKQLHVLADGLIVSLLHEPLPEPSEAHIRSLINRLQTVSWTLQKGSCEEVNKETENSAVHERLNEIHSYLLDRVNTLHSLIRVQRVCDESVCALQSSLHKRWALLEALHTRVTLRPAGSEDVQEPDTVLSQTQCLLDELGELRTQVQHCRTQLDTSINHLQTLRNSHQHLKDAMGGCAADSSWSKELLQSNTDLFSEIQEDFMSLEQQTSNFVIHLRGLSTPEEKKRRFPTEDDALKTHTLASLPSVPVYTAVLESAQTFSDSESEPESLDDLGSEKRPPRSSPFHKLCGIKRRRTQS